MPALSAAQRTAMEERVAALVRERDAIPRGEANRDRMRRVNSQLAVVRYRLAIDRPGGTPRAFAMGVRERDQTIDSPLYARGELDQPGETVPRGLVRVLCAETNATITEGSGRRELADWLASPANPLTARVIVNRVWLHLFGRGLVSTPDNFGAAGAAPSHPELLDTLAVDVHGGRLVDQEADPPDRAQPGLWARARPTIRAISRPTLITHSSGG